MRIDLNAARDDARDELLRLMEESEFRRKMAADVRHYEAEAYHAEQARLYRMALALVAKQLSEEGGAAPGTKEATTS